MAHVTRIPLEMKVVSGIKKAEKLGLLVSGDLSSVTAGESAIQTKSATQHVSVRPIARLCKNSVKKADLLQTGLASGGSIGDIYTAFPDGAKAKGFYLQ